jgi:hypothetical protein
VDLSAFLDGTYVQPETALGLRRSDGVRLLYAGRWHTLIAPTAAGKSWLLAAAAVDELMAGGAVVYVHFEESSPAGTVGRLRALGVPIEAIRQRFVWLDSGQPFAAGQFAANIPPGVRLVLLDGIAAACTLHGWPINDGEGVGAYRRHLVTPATVQGAAVLSAGHPPKARDRQDERHGLGASSWLDLVDGLGLRLVPSRTSPIGRGRRGSVALHSVKDRPGGLEPHGQPGRSAGWVYLGQVVVDDSGEQTWVTWDAPHEDDQEASVLDIGPDAIGVLGEAIVALLADQSDAFGSKNGLKAALQAAGVKFASDNLTPAILRLEQVGRLTVTKGPRGAMSGGLPAIATDPDAQ